MKKRITNVLPTLFAVCCLAGCGTVMAEVPKTSVPNEAAYESSAQAVETNQELSDEERAQEEKVRREEIAEQYSIYNEFGLSYDKDKDRFLYDGNIVRYFNDTISEDSTNAFDGSNAVASCRTAMYFMAAASCQPPHLPALPRRSL
ncbi:hypothetical protein I5Q82_15810 [Acutalibacter muris]|uniref:Uncharacterized protein n=1 Tax=Acutalibacter muris TaxID=1796620 RepID=A0AA92L4S9_9FIRM|nr:hypothetical protein [Acutalibacter muris]QQR29485.1 hypothetical protein I5Q82_15810 [Acutalibacter muris]